VRTPSVANRSLMPSGHAFERTSLALGELLVGRLQHIGVERARLLDGGDMRLGELGGGELLGLQPLAGLGQGQAGEIGHGKNP
jgi:hypothetical protein